MLYRAAVDSPGRGLHCTDNNISPGSLVMAPASQKQALEEIFGMQHMRLACRNIIGMPAMSHQPRWPRARGKEGSHADAVVVALEDTVAPELQRVADVDGDAAGDGRARVPLVHLHAARLHTAANQPAAIPTNSITQLQHSGAWMGASRNTKHHQDPNERAACARDAHAAATCSSRSGSSAHSVVAGAAVNSLSVLAGRQLKPSGVCT